MIEKIKKIMASGKQLDTIVYPSIKPYYCVPGCNFLWEAFGKFQWWKIKSKRKKLLKNEKIKMFEQKQDQDTIVYPRHKTKTQQCILTHINIMFKTVKKLNHNDYIYIYIVGSLVPVTVSTKKSTRKTTRKSEEMEVCFPKVPASKSHLFWSKWHNHFGSMMLHFALTCSTKKLENRMASKIQNAHFVGWKPHWRFLMQIFSCQRISSSEPYQLTLYLT